MNDTNNLPLLVLFIRHPTPGLVKTRLARDTSPETAAALYKCMVEIIRDNLSPGIGKLYQLCLYITPGQDSDKITNWLFPEGAPPGVHSIAQPDGSLQERLTFAGNLWAKSNAQSVFFLGSDCIDIAPGEIASAIALLAQHDAVIGPATDGGFWTLGTRKWDAQLFSGITYSEPDTCNQLRRKLRTIDWSFAEISEKADIDTLQDIAAQKSRMREELLRRFDAKGTDYAGISV